MAVILDASGNPFHTGLKLPPAGFSNPYKAYSQSFTVFDDDTIQRMLADPGRTPKSQTFADPMWVVKGDQKSHNSCGGWGGNNALSKTLYLMGNDPVVYSGAYSYSLVNGGTDDGSALVDVMNELMENGTVPVDVCPADLIYRSQTKQFDSLAAKVKGLALHSVQTQAEMNTALVRDQMVVVCIQCDTTKYVNYDGNGLVPMFKGNGDHCIHVDDLRWNAAAQRYEYRQFGNWGPKWGANGTGWCTFSAFAQPIQVHGFYVITSASNLAV